MIVRATTAVALVGALLLGGVGYDVAKSSLSSPAFAAATREGIADIARAEVGVTGDGRQCQKYGPLCDDWCAMFATWVWEQAGVSGSPRGIYVATGIGKWGLDRGLFKPRSSGGGNPQVGDLAVYGEPGSGTGGHVSVVVGVNGDGSIDTVDGNYGNRVAQRHVYPASTRSGARNVLISGYVTPPGLAGSRPVDRTEGDVTGDGFGDLTAVNAQGQLVVYGNGIKLPEFDGRPFVGVTWQTTNTNWNTDARSITTADVSGDGFADFLVLTTSGHLQIFGNASKLGNGSFFTTVWRDYPNWSHARRIAAGDVNHDGWADLAAVMDDGSLQIYLNTKETGTDALPFRAVTWTYPDHWGTDVIDIAIGDVSGDAYGDLLAIRSDGTLTVFGNGLLLPANGGRPFVNQTWQIQSGWDQVADITASDVTGDGFADLMAVTSSGELQIYGNVSGYPPHDPFNNATWIYPHWTDVHHIA